MGLSTLPNASDNPTVRYYKGELRKIKVGKTQYHPTIKIHANGNGDDTKHMDLNAQSAEVLIAWLKEEFIK